MHEKSKQNSRIPSTMTLVFGNQKERNLSSFITHEALSRKRSKIQLTLFGQIGMFYKYCINNSLLLFILVHLKGLVMAHCKIKCLDFKGLNSSSHYFSVL